MHLRRARRGAVVLVLVGTASLAAACGNDGDGSSATTASTSRSSTASNAPSTPTTVATAYLDASAEVRALLPGVRGTDVGELAARIAASFGMEEGREAEVVSVERGEPSVAVIAVRQGGDDSVAGADYRITFEGDEAGWAIASAEKRYACWRGVADDGCV